MSFDDFELEAALLGEMMQWETEGMTILRLLTIDDFVSDAHKSIFASAKRLQASGNSFDLLTLTRELRSKGELALAGGPVYITRLTNIFRGGNTKHKCKILREYTMRRRLLSLSEKMHLAANDPTADVIDSIYLTQEKLSDLFASFKSGNITHISEYAEEVYVSYVKAVESGGKLFGIPTGFARLDNATGGLQGLIYLAARPSMGKTSLMLKIARNVAKSTGPVLVVSIETSGELLTKRTLSDIARVNGQHIQTGYGTSFDIEAVRSASIQTHDLPVYFYVTGSITEAELYGIVKQMKAEKNISLVAIDYVQLMRSSIKTNNREQEISYISRGLKIITQDLKVPVLALSQLSRQVESRGDKRPHLADLRDSGSLEQDADQVMFIMRPEYYGQNSFVAANGAELPTACLAVVDLAKNKDGSTGETLLKFEPEFTSFSDYVF